MEGQCRLPDCPPLLTVVRLPRSAAAKEKMLEQHVPDLLKSVITLHSKVKPVKVQANNALKLLTGTQKKGRKFSIFGMTLGRST